LSDVLRSDDDFAIPLEKGRHVDHHPNAQRLRRGYEVFADRDLDTLREFTSPDIVWHSAGTSRIDGVFTGRDDVFEWFARLQKEAGGTQQIEIHDVLANDEHIVALVQWSARRGDKALNQRAVHVFHVNPDRQLTEFWGFTEDTNDWNEFWS
jgi:uncharacterized protein